MTDVIKTSPTDLVDPQAQRVVAFLEQIGLPSDNIIAEQSERNIIGQNLSSYIQSLAAETAIIYLFLSDYPISRPLIASISWSVKRVIKPGKTDVPEEGFLTNFHPFVKVS